MGLHICVERMNWNIFMEIGWERISRKVMQHMK